MYRILVVGLILLFGLLGVYFYNQDVAVVPETVVVWYNPFSWWRRRHWNPRPEQRPLGPGGKEWPRPPHPGPLGPGGQEQPRPGPLGPGGMQKQKLLEPFNINTPDLESVVVCYSPFSQRGPTLGPGGQEWPRPPRQNPLGPGGEEWPRPPAQEPLGPGGEEWPRPGRLGPGGQEWPRPGRLGPGGQEWPRAGPLGPGGVQRPKLYESFGEQDLAPYA